MAAQGLLRKQYHNVAFVDLKSQSFVWVYDKTVKVYHLGSWQDSGSSSLDLFAWGK